MIAKSDKFIFYHIPKTGGVWVYEAIKQAGIKTKKPHRSGFKNCLNLYAHHAIPDGISKDLNDKKNLFSFCFVRKPLGWFQSFWCYRKKHRRIKNKGVTLNDLWVDDYEEFISRVIEKYPEGFLTKMYKYYVGENLKKVDFIGRQENLKNDLIKALTLAGESFNKKAINNLGRMNVSGGYKKYGRLARLSGKTAGKILKIEKWVLNNFY